MKKEIPKPQNPDATIAFSYECDKWQNLVDEDKICQIITTTLQLGFGPYNSYEISVVFADNDFIQALNKQFLHKDKPTNVLSFPQYHDCNEITADMGHLGDIILAYETVLIESQQQEKDLQDHVRHLIVHGVLHLLGYDHIDDEEAELMQQKEIEILLKFGINNPYKDEVESV